MNMERYFRQSICPHGKVTLSAMNYHLIFSYFVSISQLHLYVFFGYLKKYLKTYRRTKKEK